MVTGINVRALTALRQVLGLADLRWEKWAKTFF